MVFTSFDPSMIDPTRTQAERFATKHYEFAAQGPSAGSCNPVDGDK
jgi:hypothetical protein